jgi:hypothetical protein
MGMSVRFLLLFIQRFRQKPPNKPDEILEGTGDSKYEAKTMCGLVKAGSV